MAFWDRFRRRSARPVGLTLESGDAERVDRSARRNLYAKYTILVALIGLSLFVFPSAQTYDVTVEVNEVWHNDEVVAPYDFSILKTNAELTTERRQVAQSEPLVFTRQDEALTQFRTNLANIETAFNQIFTTYASWQRNRNAGAAIAVQDSIRYRSLRNQLGLNLDQTQWNLLLSAYIMQVPDLNPSTSAAAQGVVIRELFRVVERAGQSILRRNVLGVPQDSLRIPDLVVQESETIERLVNARNFMALDEATEQARIIFEQQYPANLEVVDLLTTLFSATFQPNYVYQATETTERRQVKMARISATRGKIQQGQIIVQEGEVVTQETYNTLQSLARQHQQRTGDKDDWVVRSGQILLIIGIYLIFFLYLYFLRPQIFQRNLHVLLITLIFATFMGMYALVARTPSLSELAIPVAAASILLTVMFDSRVGLWGTLTLALLGGFVFGYDYEFAFLNIIVGSLAVFSVRDIKNRAQFVISSLTVLVGYAILVSALTLLRPTFEMYTQDLLMVTINALLVWFLSSSMIWVFERYFDITTDITLLELSDTNRPLLKELMQRAPGTFNHVLQVANLAEAAASAIGASPLLTRVGTLYHDIGKMLKPEYFIENQRGGDNPHDLLAPRMSALILTSHVKDGLELGRQYGLPQIVLDFIPMHHGTMLATYFFEKAKEKQDTEDAMVLEAEFRYPGPRPDTKETGILMLADAVEAASRSLDKPTPRKLETLIDTIIRARVNDDQLDNCPLTFADLSKIKQTFLALLTGIYHTRIKYPDQEENPTEPAEIEAVTPS